MAREISKRASIPTRLIGILLLLGLSSCGIGFSLRHSGASSQAAFARPLFLPPRGSISENEIAILVNDNDSQSVAVANYYQSRRAIPPANVVHLNFPAGVSTLTSAQFLPLKAKVDAALGPLIQALVITWTQPYLVQCMSITSAFTLGFDLKYCNTTGGTCGTTAQSPYYNQESTAPFTDLGIRPAMMLAGASISDVEVLIERGILATGTLIHGNGYFIRTSDSARSVRYPEFQNLVQSWDPSTTGDDLIYVDNSAGTGSDVISGKPDVLFYFTGLPTVPSITTNLFAPGAVADHLTSFGGQVPTSSQMSALAWLQAGATGSYGTVVEPCAYPQKFPDPSILVPFYFRGNSLVEAYWKSVAWPGEGLFIGDPLARPYAKSLVTYPSGAMEIQTSWLKPGVAYRLVAADETDAVYWSTIETDIVAPKLQMTRLVVLQPEHAYYRLVTP